ncbi:MAG: FAD-dependent oxidoreductase [Megasphaera sp.]|jgi:glutamate synthase (NADPH/NADH) small chain|uniref:FAD-dependent oxidoreductase n=1 Tax=Megasphaera sueciensis TaxID=349094 RepID=UPI003D080FD9|nr:FAD-dependent oxidoreductase [Megasphaera sp.]MCI1823839.1 FAD-dependent oxidoreductase [Megasphaera sp.]
MTQRTNKTGILAFEQEPLESNDYTMQEAIKEARRCLQCAVPQCRRGCPVKNEIPQFIHELALGNFGAAANYIANNSDLPAICGRVCPWEKQCEGSCILEKKGKHIEIGKLERFVADTVMDAGVFPCTSGMKANGKVAVIGSGPAGITAAYELARRNYEVTVFESDSEPGGMLMFGIPAFRLHKNYIYREIDCLQKLGVCFQYNVKIGQQKSIEDLFAEHFEAIFVGIGASAAWSLGVDNDTLPGVVDAQIFLHQVQQVQIGKGDITQLPIQAGDSVIVVGAGNVAIDAARTAVRLGADVTIVYRRAEHHMKCLPSEYQAAKNDGVKFKFYSAPRAVVGATCVEGLQYEKQKILEDATMVPTGEFGVVPANKIIAAIGNRPEMDCINALQVNASNEGYISITEKPYGMTSRVGVFAAGDIVHKPATVVLAMREGKKTAIGIDRYIQAKHLLEGIKQFSNISHLTD